MRINKFVAKATGLSRRAADQAIKDGRVTINGRQASLGDDTALGDSVALDGGILEVSNQTVTIMLNKPLGYVCSRAGQGNPTVYDLLPAEYGELKPVGRLDKDSSGLLLLTNDGGLANQLTHPSFAKTKVYEITLDKPLADADKTRIGQGVQVEDYVSRLELSPLGGANGWRITMTQGKNRQIRRTFAALGYNIETLHRTHFGPYDLGDLRSGRHQKI